MESEQLHTLLNLLNEFNMENDINMESVDETIYAVKEMLKDMDAY
jgi:hypothetical protein